MILIVKAAKQLQGRVNLPSSKSYSIRAFLIAACGGVSTIINPSDCDDAKVALKIAKQLGAKVIQSKNNTYKIIADQEPGRKIAPTADFNVGESGTVLRFLLPLLALRQGRFRISGTGTLKGRPNLFLVQALRKMGARIRGAGAQESIPLTMEGGHLRAGKIEVDASLSSQFISALLIACPQLKGNTRLTLTGGKVVSELYLTMTQRVLRLSKVKVGRKSPSSFFIKGGQKFYGLGNFVVPSDYGLAAFLIAAAVLTESDVVLDGMFNDKFVQADGEILPLLRKMGAKFEATKTSIKIKGPQTLKGGNFSLKNCPDLVPIMAVMALFAKGKTRLYDIGHARAKESDRIGDLRRELLKAGAKIRERRDELTIYPQSVYRRGALLDPHHDHRLAMAFSVLGLKLFAKIKDIECVSKSYPQFVKDFKKIGALVSSS